MIWPSGSLGLVKNISSRSAYDRPEKFFGTTFRPSFVTVHKCDGRDLASTSLKMAADSTLNGAVKYVYPDRHFVTFCRGKANE